MFSDDGRSFIFLGLSVSVDALTLVCISVERYLAICCPFIMLRLKSMPHASLWNTLNLFTIWIFGLLTALPNLYMYNLCFLPTLQRFKCEKSNLESLDERIYMIVLDGNCLSFIVLNISNFHLMLVVYFSLPFTAMTVFYVLIIMKMSETNMATMTRSLQSEFVVCRLLELVRFDSVRW